MDADAAFDAAMPHMPMSGAVMRAMGTALVSRPVVATPIRPSMLVSLADVVMVSVAGQPGRRHDGQTEQK